MIDEKQRTTDSFINDAMIEKLLAEAGSKAGDKIFVRGIIDKALEHRGLSAGEVAILLEVRDPELLKEMYAAAAKVNAKVVHSYSGMKQQAPVL